MHVVPCGEGALGTAELQEQQDARDGGRVPAGVVHAAYPGMASTCPDSAEQPARQRSAMTGARVPRSNWRIALASAAGRSSMMKCPQPGMRIGRTFGTRA